MRRILLARICARTSSSPHTDAHEMAKCGEAELALTERPCSGNLPLIKVKNIEIYWRGSAYEVQTG